MLITLSEHTFEEFQALVQTDKPEILVSGHRVKTQSQRYALFLSEEKGQGRVCQHCGGEGVIVRLQKQPDPVFVSRAKKPKAFAHSAHFNLYTEQGALLTKDHIRPRSKGGKDVMDNYQTLCYPCNSKKSGTFP